MRKPTESWRGLIRYQVASLQVFTCVGIKVGLKFVLFVLRVIGLARRHSVSN